MHCTPPRRPRFANASGGAGGPKLARRLIRMRNQPGANLQETTILAVLRDLARRTKATNETIDHYKSTRSDLVRVLHPTLLEEPG